MCWTCKVNRAWRFVTTEVGTMHLCGECIEKRVSMRTQAMARYAEQQRVAVRS